MNNPTDEAKVRAVGEKINKILNDEGMGMQAVIQIFTVQTNMTVVQGTTSDPKIITPGSEQDLPPAITEMLKPVGNEITRK